MNLDTVRARLGGADCAHVSGTRVEHNVFVDESHPSVQQNAVNEAARRIAAVAERPYALGVKDDQGASSQGRGSGAGIS